MVTLVSSVRTAESIEMPFRVWTHVEPRNRVLDGVRTGRHPANTIERPVLGGDESHRYY